MSQHVQLTLCRWSVLKGSRHPPASTRRTSTRLVVTLDLGKTQRGNYISDCRQENWNFLSIYCILQAFYIFPHGILAITPVLTDKEVGLIKLGDVAKLIQGPNGGAGIQTVQESTCLRQCMFYKCIESKWFWKRKYLKI